MLKSRVDIKNFIVSLEQQFPVNEWKFDNVHIWPLLRIRIFFHFIQILEVEKNTDSYQKQQTKKPLKKVHFVRRVVYSLKIRTSKIIKGLKVLLWIFKLKHKNHVFVAADAHRVNYKNSRYNRFFDVLIEERKIKDSALVLEYGLPAKDKLYNSEIVQFLDKKLKDYCNYKALFLNLTEPKVVWEQYEDFLISLRSHNCKESFLNAISFQNLTKWYQQNFRIKRKFFQKILKKLKPQEIYILCYYSETIMALIHEANLLHIKTFEMQHGPQTTTHLAYGSWSKVPSEGYHTIPRNFLCWNEQSKSVVKQWFGKNNLYKFENFGHPWLNYWKKKKREYVHKNYILYSLQPSPISFNQLFFPELIEIIKNSDKTWFIRLHPRQLHEYKRIESFLKDKDILNKVNIADATNDPLPLVLSNATMHVTHSSGTTLEAEYFNVKTILLDETGKEYYRNLIQNKSAYFINYKDVNFKEKFLVYV